MDRDDMQRRVRDMKHALQRIPTTEWVGTYLGVETETGRPTTIKTRYMRFFEFVGAMQSPGRFLDIGAGMGFSLDVAVEHGWQATGIEPNRHLAAHARSRGVNVENRFLDASFTGGFDLILLDNVLEHVPDPANFLGHASRLLAQRGVMVIAVPPLDWLRKALARSSYVRDQVQAPQLNVFCEVDDAA